MTKFLSIQDRRLEGIVVVNKPKGITSHDVVSRVRKIFNMRRVGHAGTLDPLATGVLVVLLGRSTKLFDKFQKFEKAYKATLILGKKTTTADIQGDVVKEMPYENFTKEHCEGVFKGFLGDTEQVPPMYSAIKFNGKKLYELARKGIEVKRDPRKIRISELKIIDFQIPRISFSLLCSKGTYVRQLAEDIAEKLNTVAFIERIQRTAVGPLVIEDAVDLENLKESDIKNWEGE